MAGRGFEEQGQKKNLCSQRRMVFFQWVFFQCSLIFCSSNLVKCRWSIPRNTTVLWWLVCRQVTGVAFVLSGQDEVGFEVAALSNYVAAWPTKIEKV